MSLFVLDTDMVSLYQDGHPAVVNTVHDHPLSELAVSVITVDEHLTGWYTLVRRAKKREQLARAYSKLAMSVQLLAGLQILSFTEKAMDRYDCLRDIHRNVGKNDLRIAAIVLEKPATLVTRNLRDFQDIAGLQVQDWSK
jgi:tRNA(fMet)-specific endonuclease VapC